WDARTVSEGNNSSADPSNSPSNGEYWVVSIAGTRDLDGESDWQVGDWAIYNGTSWQKINNTGNVVSFNGRKGAIVPLANDYTWAQIDKSVSSLNDIADVDYTNLPSDGKILIYNGVNGKWEPQPFALNNITSNEIADGTIKNSDVSTTAAIAMSKINGLLPALDTKVNTTGGSISGSLNLGAGANINMAVNATVDGVDIDALNTTVTGLSTSKQDNIIFPNDTNKYLSGDGTFQNISNLTLTTTLTGVDLVAASTTINVTDSILDAFGKVQNQINSITGGSTTSVQKSGDIMTGNLDLQNNTLSAGTINVAENISVNLLGNFGGGININGSAASIAANGDLSAKNADFDGNTTSNIHTTNTLLKLKDNDGADHFIELKAPASLAAGYTITFPNVAPTTDQIMKYDGANYTWIPVPTPTAGTVTSLTTGVGLLGGTITTSGTIDIDVGAGPNQIVQLDGSGILPALDGSALTNLNLASISGLGSIATQDSSAINITGGTIDSITLSNSTAALNSATISSGSIENTTIGLATPLAANFTSVGAGTPGSGAFTSLTANSIDNTPIGASTPSTGAFSSIDIDAGTIDNVSLGSNTVISYLGLDNIILDSSTISTLALDSDLIISPNGLGKVGLGTASPTSKLSIREEGAATSSVSSVLDLTYETSGTASSGIGTGITFKSEDDSGSVEDIGAIEFEMTDTGNGTETSKINFMARSLGSALTNVFSVKGNGEIEANGNILLKTISDNSNATAIHVEKTPSDGNIRFDTSSTERMMIASSGFVGIGTDAPSSLLSLKGNDEVFRLEGSTNAHLGFYQVATRKAYIGHETANDNFLTIKAENSSVANEGDIYLQPDLGAHVGIKTNDPITPLEVMEDDNNDSNVTNILTLTHMSSTPANGIGAAVAFRSENNNGAPSISTTLSSTLTDITNGFEDGNFFISNLKDGTLTERFNIDADGNTTVKGGDLSIEANKELRLLDNTGGEYVGLKSPEPLGSSYTLTLPTTVGTAGQILSSDGAGNTSWVDDPVGALTPLDSNIIVGDGSGWVAETGDTARTSLGLGSADAVTFSTVSLDNGTSTSIANDGVTFTDGESFYVRNQSNVGAELVSGTTSWAALSDERLKRDIAYVPNSIEKLSKIRGVYFNYLNDEYEDQQRVGVIAQEVHEVLPEAVNEGKDGYLKVKLSEIIPLLINATNEQQNQLIKNNEMYELMRGSFKKEIVGLTNRIKVLEKENAMLKSYLCSKDPNAPFCN
ncbi:MAG: tail fiber domain-containing protein, partial [Bacteriovoracaceae bacterium]